MSKRPFQHLALVVALAAVSTFAQAESRLSAATSGQITANAKITVSVTVPKILYLRVGTAGATQDVVNFVVGPSGLTGVPVTDTAFAGAVPVGPGSVTVTDTDASAGAAGAISAQLWSNTGTATLSCTSTAIGSGAVTLPKADFKVTSTAGATALLHPGGDLSCTGAGVTVGAAGGAGAFASTWNYSYNPTTLPPAGTYTGTVTYTAVQP